MLSNAFYAIYTFISIEIYTIVIVNIRKKEKRFILQPPYCLYKHNQILNFHSW